MMTETKKTSRAVAGPQAARPWVKPGRKITDDTKATFLFGIEETGNQQKAADMAGCSVGAIRRHTNPDAPCFDPEFAEAWAEAYERFVDGLRSHAVKRATEGWREPILGGLARDQIVAYKPVYSDRLLELLLKRHDQNYRDKVTVEQNKTVRNIHSLDLSGLSTDERTLVRQLLESKAKEKEQKVIDVESTPVEDDI